MRNDLINILSESYPQYSFEEIYDGEAIAVGKKNENNAESQAKAIFYDYMSLDDIENALNDENFLENAEVTEVLSTIIKKEYKDIRNNLTLMLVPATKKYENVLHKHFKNLLIVPIIDYEDKDYTVLMQKSMFPDVTEDQIFEDAQLNLNKRELEIVSLTQYLRAQCPDVPDIVDDNGIFFIRWKANHMLGASTFLHPDFAKGKGSYRLERSAYLTEFKT